MSDRSQPFELPKDPVRIVYHAENKTFARLFNEHSLNEVKHVVRRKLGLEQQTDVSLKQQTSSGALLDLEDDDDFQAFCVLLRSSVSVDIQVTVGNSPSSTGPPPVAPQSPEQLSVNEPTTTSSALPFGQLARSAAPGQFSVRPEPFLAIQASATAFKSSDLSARKRKVSFDETILVNPDNFATRQTPKKVTSVTPTASAETAGTPAVPKPVSAEEPPKKKQKKAATKAKDVQPAGTVLSSPTKDFDTPKPKPKKSAALDPQVETSTLMDPAASAPLAKQPEIRKKDDGAGLKKSSVRVGQEVLDQPIDQSNNPVMEAPLQADPEKPKKTKVVGGTSKTRKPRAPRGTACAAIPRTNESSSVQSEVATAILSGYLSKESETVPPEPPAKRKSVKKVTKKSSTSSSALPTESSTVSIAYTNVSTERRLEGLVLTNRPPPQQTMELSGPPCPICLEEPFHIRYCCPTVLKGPDAIRERLEELKRMNRADQQSLIKELEGLFRDSKATSKRSLDAAPVDGVQSREVSLPPDASPLRIPSNSHVSEVTVESKDEGSSSDSSDDTSKGRVEHIELPAPQGQKTSNKQPSLADDNLEAVIRGPSSKRQSILHVIDRIVGDDDDAASDSEEDVAELEEDPDEEVDRSRRRPSRYSVRSSDSEGEDEDEDGSRSPPPSRSVEGISNNLQSGTQGSNKPAEESIKHQDNDVVMGDPADPPVPEGHDDGGSEETHVGSEDRMNVDHESIGEKGATIVEQQPLFPAPRVSVLPLSHTLGSEPQDSGQTEVDPASNQGGGVPVASVVPDEVEADPIEPADDLGPPTISLSLNADAIEAPEDIETLFADATQSTPKSRVTKRIKTRIDQTPDDEVERPVLLEQESTNEVTPFPKRGRPMKKITEMSASQEQPAPTRRSPRFSSNPPSTCKPAATVLLNHRIKVGARGDWGVKTAAKRSADQSDASQGSIKDIAVQNGARIAHAPSLNRWEALAEPLSSPSLQLDEPSVRIDELMSSSPQPDNNPTGRLNDKQKKGRSRKPASPSQAESPQGKERLFDLSSSQIPFPYSQYQNNPAPTVFPNGKESEETTDLEEKPKRSQKKTKLPVRYRSLSQLASQATLFSPSLPKPANKSMTNGKTKNRIDDEDPSSSSSSDANEANGSAHIPRRQRAGSALEKRSRQSKI